MNKDNLQCNSFDELELHLRLKMMFTYQEINDIMHAIGSADIQSVIGTCSLLGIELIGNDIKDLLTSYEE
jgi:hypothetical protein